MTKIEADIVPGMGEAIEARMVAMDLSPTAFAAASGVTLPGLAPLRRGIRKTYQHKVKIGVARALHWGDDWYDRLLDGQPPVELDPPVRQATLEERMDQVLETLAEIRRLLAERESEL